ncbi:uncharacterized protein LOC128553275 [Mercenaria mercenaria]|uniref:uncharacterized protein LOC128553275 n=1 Tax=Mercenaria mercenaria TaxID=6596 RepID=UPI00234EE05B|nr:uncharacterized protein LOC128553275 [Mercenaria mercenaria]
MPFLLPSDIYYSKRSISNEYGTQLLWYKKPIGEYLDDLCCDRRNISDMPQLQVRRPLGRMFGRWVADDNETLWIYRQLEKNGKCMQIQADQVSSFKSWISLSLTALTGTISAEVEGAPGGNMCKTNNNFLDTFRKIHSLAYEYIFRVMYLFCCLIFLYWVIF